MEFPNKMQKILLPFTFLIFNIIFPFEMNNPLIIPINGQDSKLVILSFNSFGGYIYYSNILNFHTIKEK